MTGYAHQTCDTKVYCPHLQSDHCICCLSEEDARQKYLDPALIFVKGPRDNRIVHFIQPRIEKVVSEYRSNYSWPEKKRAVKPYVPPKENMRFETKAEYNKIYPIRKHHEKFSKPSKEWNKGIAENFFE